MYSLEEWSVWGGVCPMLNDSFTHNQEGITFQSQWIISSTQNKITEVSTDFNGPG